MNVFEVQMPDLDAARAIARRLYQRIRGAHDWGQRFDAEPADAVLDRLAEMAPREMRRAWMTGFGNAKLDGRGTVEVRDLPEASGKKGAIGFVH
jgi:ATP-dependent Lon protease